jgi:ABC-type antimicrobial peptide transport system permease subunit
MVRQRVLAIRLRGFVYRTARNVHGESDARADRTHCSCPRDRQTCAQCAGAQARGLSRSVFFLLLGLSVIGAALAMLVIGLVTQQSVKVRQGEIRIRRAIGALPDDILKQVVAEGIAVSVIGGLLGLGLGIPTAWLLARWQALGLGFSAVVILGPLLLVALAALSGVLPARAAARLDPAVALRSR